MYEQLIEMLRKGEIELKKASLTAVRRWLLVAEDDIGAARWYAELLELVERKIS